MQGDSGQQQLLRLALWVPGALALVVGLWAGLGRLGLAAVGASAHVHGTLMAMGFLGTLISLERAAALGSRWAHLVPALFGLGAVGTVVGLPFAPLSFLLGAVGLALLFARLLMLDKSVHMIVMTVASGAMLGGAALLAAGHPTWVVAWWWAGFLVLTIVGERIELNRVRQLPTSAILALLVLVGSLVTALFALLFVPDAAIRLLGLCLAAMARWLLTFDVALQTVHRRGLTRYVAWCLLTGYAWLGIAGVLALFYGFQMGGPIYDAQLHAVFVGFVFSMIFGHAPVILPAVLGLPLRYTKLAYGPLLLLHAGLVVRVVGDLAMMPGVRQVGGAANVGAVALFAAVSVLSMLVRVDVPARMSDPVAPVGK